MLSTFVRKLNLRRAGNEECYPAGRLASTHRIPDTAQKESVSIGTIAVERLHPNNAARGRIAALEGYKWCCDM